MKRTFLSTVSLLAISACSLQPLVSIADEDEKDFGLFVQHQLEAKSEKLFGINQRCPPAPTALTPMRIMSNPWSSPRD